jgi:hypothetical protein
MAEQRAMIHYGGEGGGGKLTLTVFIIRGDLLQQSRVFSRRDSIFQGREVVGWQDFSRDWELIRMQQGPERTNGRQEIRGTRKKRSSFEEHHQ